MTFEDTPIRSAVLTDNIYPAPGEDRIRIETVLFKDDKFIGTDLGAYDVDHGTAARGSRRLIGVVEYFTQ